MKEIEIDFIYVGSHNAIHSCLKLSIPFSYPLTKFLTVHQKNLNQIFRSEVRWIYAGIITSSLFRVNVPSLSKVIGFGTKMSRMESDDEVELTEEFRALDLVTRE